MVNIGKIAKYSNYFNLSRKMSQHELQFLGGDAALVVFAEHTERLLVAHFFIFVRLQFLRQSSSKLGPLNLAAVVGVNVVDDVLNFLLIRVNTSENEIINAFSSE